MCPRTLSRWTLPALAALAVGAQPVLAQDRHELLDEDVEPLVRLLRADIAVVRWYTQRASDPLAELQRVAKFPLVPPGARYEAQCSRGHHSGALIFSLADTNPPRSKPTRLQPAPGGIDTVRLPGHGMSIAGFFDTVQKGLAPLAPYGDRMNARGAWYARHGYRARESSGFIPYRVRDIDRRRRVVVDVEGPELHWAECVHVRSPAIAVSVETFQESLAETHDPFQDSMLVRPFEREEGAPRSEVEEAFEEALHEEGLTEPEFRRLYELIVHASQWVTLSPEQRERELALKNELGRERTEASLRWFRQHGHRVMPLIEQRRRAFEHASAARQAKP